MVMYGRLQKLIEYIQNVILHHPSFIVRLAYGLALIFLYPLLGIIAAVLFVFTSPQTSFRQLLMG